MAASARRASAHSYTLVRSPSGILSLPCARCTRRVCPNGTSAPARVVTVTDPPPHSCPLLWVKPVSGAAHTWQGARLRGTVLGSSGHRLPRFSEPPVISGSPPGCRSPSS